MNDVNQPPPHDTVSLAAVLRDAAQELRHLQPPDELRRRVVARARPCLAPRRAPWRAALAWSGATACALVLGVALLLLAVPQAPRDDVPERSASGFVPLVGPERWRQLTSETATPAWLLSTELPRERLVAIGLPFDPARAAEPVRAELLMHASGDVIAVRVIGQ